MDFHLNRQITSSDPSRDQLWHSDEIRYKCHQHNPAAKIHPLVMLRDSDPRPRFPVEIFDLFIDVLAAYDRTDLDTAIAALRNCSLVSRSFAHRARTHLFRVVELGGYADNSIDRAFGLYHLLGWTSSTPGAIGNITPLVKDLFFDYEDAPKSPRLEAVVASILQLLNDSGQGITDFTIAHDGNWSDLGAELKSELCRLIRSPGMRYLHLRGLEGVPKTLLLGTGIESLILEQITCSETPEAINSISDDPLQGNQSYPRLARLRLDQVNQRATGLLGNSDSMARGTNHSALTALHELSITVFNQADCDALAQLLMHTEETLGDLRILMGFVSFHSVIDLRRMKRLNVVHVGPVDIGLDLRQALLYFELLLGIVMVPDTLESLNLGFLVDITLDEWVGDQAGTLASFLETLSEPPESNVWRPLNDIFWTRFSKVAQVDISLGFHQDTSQTPVVNLQFIRRAEELIRMALPFFSGKAGSVPALKVDVAPH
ncbi:unnamed protein product [Cyclocybe aegerita]|uniref:Uncharacterized protein n=1 Tax=Cyclocybe aegerita TaxID=1973307 RepID=A0A8S0W393_CYCAE|nr:unnamed protein product [Cyclocybe aegerita]